MRQYSPEQAEQIAEVLRQLDEHPDEAAHASRRAKQRQSFRTPMTVLLLVSAGPAPVNVYMRNVSPGGLGFVSRRLFRKDERIAVRLKLAKMHGKIVLARITFSRYITEGLHEMGAEFLEAFTDPTGNCRVPSHWINSVVRTAQETTAK